MYKTKCFSIFVAVMLLVGCATPPKFVQPSKVMDFQLERMQTLDCPELDIAIAAARATEKRQSDEMAGRTTKQLALNAVGIAGLAVGGFGMVFMARGETAYRESLANTLGEIAELDRIQKAKGCVPSTSVP